MTITRQQKEKTVRDLSEKFSRSKSIVFLGFQGLTVKEDTDLRNKLREENIDFKVARKTLIRRSLKEVNIEGVDDIKLDGPIGAAIGYDDEIAPARIANEFAKTNNKLILSGGYISNKYLDATEIKALALLPGKDQLRAQLVGTIKAPVSGFVNVLSGNLRGLVNVVKAISDDKKE
ncbi:50S ribosomal protein L10 [Candidatus Parcubacteria bacterium]|nr:50S ribosomal protein L10 [Candidatus Parcubacteria bacterium]